jgi:nicotinamide-nucleotide amidase
VIVEVIAVGTELLIGQIINSNTAAIGSRLAEEGFDAHYQVTVGDNLDRLADAIRTALGRADAVVMTGGIGPTQDDMTREAICEVTGAAMARDEAHAAKIHDRLMKTRGYVAENTLRMSDYPAGSEPLPNRKGVALGVAIEHEGRWIFAMPGVPSEMIPMLEEEVMPRLREASGEPAVLKSRVIRTWGYGESQVAEILDDLYESANPSVAFLINAAEVRIRISAKAASDAAAAKMIAGVEATVVERLGDAIFAYDDDVIETIVVALLAERGWTIATVESSTLGMVATQISATPGGPAVFAGGRVVRAGAPPLDVERRALELLEEAPPADVAVAISEISAGADAAGETSSRLVGVAVRTPERTMARTVGLLGDDERARRFSVPGALHAVRLAVSGAWWEQ